jgi:hypothetical protein
MVQNDYKPLNWAHEPGIGYVVVRRPDGGLQVTFTDVSHATLDHWREFALGHLLDSDRLTRNLYDLRAIRELPQEAIQYALEVNADPSVRNLHVAVVVNDTRVKKSIEEIAALTPGGVELAVFTDFTEAEAWLSRPLTHII